MKVIANSKGNTEIMKYKQLAVITSVLLFQPTLQRSFVKRLAKLERLDQLKTTRISKLEKLVDQLKTTRIDKLEELVDQLKTTRINKLERETTDLRTEIEVLKDKLDEFFNDDPSDVTNITPTSSSQTIEPTDKLPNAEYITATESVYNFVPNDLQDLNTGNH